jgi:hypothetical protein
LIHGFLGPYLQKNMLAPEKKGPAPELFLVLSTSGFMVPHKTSGNFRCGAFNDVTTGSFGIHYRPVITHAM